MSQRRVRSAGRQFIMGDRGQVRIIEEATPDLYFYTHWQATQLPAIVSSALQRGINRWDDSPYLSRIIFSEMIQDEVMSEIGYGITTFPSPDVWRTVTVDQSSQTVEVSDNDYLWTFQEFVAREHWSF
jgi:hypothetical protein